jgi:hypothetical protein
MEPRQQENTATLPARGRIEHKPVDPVNLHDSLLVATAMPLVAQFVALRRSSIRIQQLVNISATSRTTSSLDRSATSGQCSFCLPSTNLAALIPRLNQDVVTDWFRTRARNVQR